MYLLSFVVNISGELMPLQEISKGNRYMDSF